MFTHRYKTNKQVLHTVLCTYVMYTGNHTLVFSNDSRKL